MFRNVVLVFMFSFVPVAPSTVVEESKNVFASIRATLKFWRETYDSYYDEISLGYCWADYFLKFESTLAGLPMPKHSDNQTKSGHELPNNTTINSNIFEEYLTNNNNGQQTNENVPCGNEKYKRRKRSPKLKLNFNHDKIEDEKSDKKNLEELSIFNIFQTSNKRSAINEDNFRITKTLPGPISAETTGYTQNNISISQSQKKRGRIESTPRSLTDFQMDSSLPKISSDKEDLFYRIRRSLILERQPRISKMPLGFRLSKDIDQEDGEKNSGSNLPRRSSYRAGIQETPKSEGSFEDSSSSLTYPKLSQGYRTIFHGYGSQNRAKDSEFIKASLLRSVINPNVLRVTLKSPDKNTFHKFLHKKKDNGLFRGEKDTKHKSKISNKFYIKKNKDSGVIFNRFIDAIKNIFHFFKRSGIISHFAKFVKNGINDYFNSRNLEEGGARDVPKFSPLNTTFFKDSKGEESKEFEGTLPLQGIKDERFMVDYGGAGNQTSENSKQIVFPPHQVRNRRSSNLILKQRATSIFSSIVQNPIVVSLLRTLGLFIHVGRQIMDIVESVEVLSCTVDYLWTKLLQWIDS